MTEQRDSNPLTRVFQSDTDWYVATSVEEVKRMRIEKYGYSEEDNALDTFRELPAHENLTISFGEAVDGQPPNWAARLARTGPPHNVSIQWEPYTVQDEAVNDVQSKFARVTAPAWVWAMNGTGMIGSTEL